MPLQVFGMSDLAAGARIAGGEREVSRNSRTSKSQIPGGSMDVYQLLQPVWHDRTKCGLSNSSCGKTERQRQLYIGNLELPQRIGNFAIWSAQACSLTHWKERGLWRQTDLHLDNYKLGDLTLIVRLYPTFTKINTRTLPTAWPRFAVKVKLNRGRHRAW